MRDGILMQAGTPQEIHDQPRNLFVADFMGFRNFFPVRVRAVAPDGSVEAEGNGMTVRGRTRHALAPGAAAVAAIRPDDVAVGEHGAGPNVFRAKAEIVEYLGRENETILTLEAGPRVWVRTTERVDPGEAVGVRFPVDKVIFLPPDGAEAGT
jgi:putative spermidine/putrescine transport system ATP-binding protein